MFRTGVLVAATVAMGLMAGLFTAFAYAIMPALSRGDDRTFVGAMQSINVAILNGWFFLGFVGALVLPAVAAVLHLGRGSRAALPWILAGFLLYVVVLAVTFGFNIPLNDRLAAAGAPDRIPDLAAVREQFEAAWIRWNVVRALASTAALGCLAWALVVSGRIAA
jgi:uncharacterized membrane protein